MYPLASLDLCGPFKSGQLVLQTCPSILLMLLPVTMVARSAHLEDVVIILEGASTIVPSLISSTKITKTHVENVQKSVPMVVYALITAISVKTKHVACAQASTKESVSPVLTTQYQMKMETVPVRFHISIYPSNMSVCCVTPIVQNVTTLTYIHVMYVLLIISNSLTVAHVFLSVPLDLQRVTANVLETPER